MKRIEVVVKDLIGDESLPRREGERSEEERKSSRPSFVGAARSAACVENTTLEFASSSSSVRTRVTTAAPPAPVVDDVCTRRSVTYAISPCFVSNSNASSSEKQINGYALRVSVALPSSS